MAKRIIRVTQDDINSGAPWSGMNCPVSRAIRRETGIQTWAVGALQISAGREVFKTPRSVRRFIRKFDRHEAVTPFNFELVQRPSSW